MRPVPGNLPAELNRFVGRTDELAELTRLLTEFRLITLVGVGGVGKTRLAVRAAAQALTTPGPEDLEKRYFDGVWLAELSPIRDPGLLDHALVDALRITDHSGRPPREVLRGHLADRRLLLVLDGFEQLVDPCAELVRDLLRRCPGLRVLAVGRRPLRLEGERAFPLAPLDEADAARLFADRAADILAGSCPLNEHGDAVRELCRWLDGIPLALELAAARLRTLSLDQILRRIDDRFQLLTEGSRGELPRHRTLRTAIGWSHELCTPAERLLWARLSVFAGPFDLEAVEYVCVGPDLPAEGVLDVLGELIAQSVVVREDTAAGVRYRMLDTVRAYGAEWLDALADTGRMRRRHRDWYMGLATWCELDWFSPRQAEIAAVTDSALPNLRAAIELCLETAGETRLGQCLAGTLWFYWAGCGRLTEGRHWLDRALAPAARPDTSWHEPPRASAHEPPHEGSRLKALWVLGYVAILQGDNATAARALHECREEATHAGNALAHAYAVHRLGCLALLTGDMPRAERLLRSAIGSYDELGEINSNVLMGRAELALSLVFLGDLDAAVALCADVREICEDSGERWARSYALYVHAYAAWTRGRLTEARALLGEAVTIHHTFNDMVGLALAMELMALVTAGEGDPAKAAVLQGAAARLWRSVGVPLFGSATFGGPHERCERRAREALGAQAYDARVAEGRALSQAAAVERALAGPRGVSASVPPGRSPDERGPARDRETDRETVRDQDREPGRGTDRETREPAGSPGQIGGEAAG
ncbi:regulator [Streptomyces sp. IB2014 016-6]|uniref:ATP-binding protein n=1 Tax=Streptomyces sp. IB2014 016-6 TaxID=2517818 RepID=UPI0011C7513D|nr:regulator [Streptomyces sp. IB2014 016-6]TXL86043.1 regulator [Streptomyces sp. IB2014 016-6]